MVKSVFEKPKQAIERAEPAAPMHRTVLRPILYESASLQSSERGVPIRQATPAQHKHRLRREEDGLDSADVRRRWNQVQEPTHPGVEPDFAGVGGKVELDDGLLEPWQ
jgi:hypothetical protein